MNMHCEKYVNMGCDVMSVRRLESTELFTYRWLRLSGDLAFENGFFALLDALGLELLRELRSSLSRLFDGKSHVAPDVTMDIGSRAAVLISIGQLCILK